MIITIARQCGCMGDQIGKALAEKYFIPFYDKDAVCRPVSYTHLTLPTTLGV